MTRIASPAASHAWQPAIDEACELGESPFWHPLEQRLYYIDIPAKQLLRAEASGAGGREVWGMPSEPGCMAPVRGGGLVIALRDGIYRAREWGGALECLVRFGYDTATTRFNDGKCDSLGRFWAGTVFEPRDGRRGAELYCIDMRSGTPVTTLKANNAITANGVNWSLDDRTLWWSDTPNHIIHAWDFERETGVMRKHRVFHQFDPKPADWVSDAADARSRYGGRPDGSAVDSAGIYHCAMYEGGRICSFAPDGTPAGEETVPVVCPTMPCFGGADLRTLFLTTARKGRSAAELAATPWAGRVLARRVQTPGLPVHFFDCGD
jgi:sugar lactone lactonase YvrE